MGALEKARKRLAEVEADIASLDTQSETSQARDAVRRLYETIAEKYREMIDTLQR